LGRAGVPVKEPAREADGQAHRVAPNLQQVAEAVVLHRLYNMAIRGGKGQGRAQVVGMDEDEVPTPMRPSRPAFSNRVTGILSLKARLHGPISAESRAVALGRFRSHSKCSAKLECSKEKGLANRFANP